jgi:hypothetical protein
MRKLRLTIQVRSRGPRIRDGYCGDTNPMIAAILATVYLSGTLCVVPGWLVASKHQRVKPFGCGAWRVAVRVGRCAGTTLRGNTVEIQAARQSRANPLPTDVVDRPRQHSVPCFRMGGCSQHPRGTQCLIRTGGNAPGAKSKRCQVWSADPMTSATPLRPVCSRWHVGHPERCSATWATSTRG